VVHTHPDPYAVLGVTPASTPAEITQAFRTKLRTLHPDARGDDFTPDDDDRLRQVLAAYVELRRLGQRAGSDEHRNVGGTRVEATLRAGPVRRHR
jgi:curved DNA-binding protein CbpA